MPEKVVPISISGYSPDPAGGTASIREFGPRERLLRGVKAAGLCWGVALVGVLIPVAHFIIVPGGILFGCYLLITRLRIAVVPVKCQGACPDCGTRQDFDLGNSWVMPTSVTCAHCSRGLAVSTASED